MLSRHTLDRRVLLGLALAVSALAVGSATVRAGDGDDREPLHVERHVPYAPVAVDRAVIDRSSTLRRLDRLLDGIDDVAEAAQTPWRRGFGPLRLAVQAGAMAGVPARVDDSRGPPVGRGQPGARGDQDREELSRRGPFGGRGPDGVENGLYELRVEVLRLRDEIAAAPVLRPAPVVVALSARDLRDLMLAVRRATFGGDKVAVVEDAAAHWYFTSEQAAEILGAIPSWGQVDAAFALHGRLVDPQADSRLYDAITFSSDREALRRRVRAQR